MSVLLPAGTGETPGNKQQQQLTRDKGLSTLIVSHTYGACHWRLHLGRFYEETQAGLKKNGLQCSDLFFFSC